MTQDVIALTPHRPDVWHLTAGLLAAGPEAHIDVVEEGALLHLCDQRGHPLATVEAPALIHVPGEAERLLGASARGVPTPVWWTESRASSMSADGPTVARAIAERLALTLDGTVWPPHDAPSTTADDRGGVLDLDMTAVPAPAAAQPAVDVLTDRAAVLLQDRHLVPATAWFTDALRAAVASERTPQLVTPATTRLTRATHALLTQTEGHWIVDDGPGDYYDGFTGIPARWEDGAFAPVLHDGQPFPPVAAFTQPPGLAPSDGHQLTLTFRLCHRPTARLQLGGALDAAWNVLTGRPPAGWGTAEPVAQPWDPEKLTAFARERAPQPTWFVTVGGPDRPLQATTRISRTVKGVEEQTTLVLGGSPGRVPVLDDPREPLRALAERLATEHGLITLLAQRGPGRADLTVPPHHQGAPAPVAFTLGAQETAETGLPHAQCPPAPLTSPHRLGDAARPALHYDLPHNSPASGWQGLDTLLGHLRGGASGTPLTR
ncbi:DUF6177 family protein [Streptomyces sp. NPDC048172]|uniref:DUF6177 family protein n=1 Tax=Streptomyces sp. NPDC048172 TaxID=3365505 RepID=UPI00372319A2